MPLSTPRTTLVFGPAYLDRVLRVDRPLVDPSVGGAIDRSVTGRLLEDSSTPLLRVEGLPEGDLSVVLPADWPGPSGTIRVDEGLAGPPALSPRPLVGLDWRDDLGGMGAGFAGALGGTLHLVLGDELEPIGGRVVELLKSNGIDHRTTRIVGRLGEWTLLLTSGEHGDKLPIGFRDPGQVEVPPVADPGDPCDLLVVASMTNRRASAALERQPARVRLFAPSIRNMNDRAPKVSAFARHIDILCCNRGEWEALDDREEVAWRLSILSVTDGPRGASIRYTRTTGDPGHLTIPAFPRRSPPRDTNRAGEAFASALVSTLLDHDWSPGTAPDDLMSLAGLRASAAAALVLDRVDFGFPTAEEVDRALSRGNA